jgi:hypothetical protein
MKAIDALLASYLDLARHLDPLRFPEGAPPEIAHRLGRFDPASMRAQVVALRSIANALEDLEDVDALDDEVDRTMLLDTIRADIVRLDVALASTASNPALPLVHLSDALDDLLGEDFDAAVDAALRERIAAFPGFLALLRDDVRPVPSMTLDSARIEASLFDQGTLDMASERLDDATVQPALVAIAEHREWLDSPERGGGAYGVEQAQFEAQLVGVLSEPLGVKGTLRLLELRRAGVERSLASAAAELGADVPLACAQQLLTSAQPASDVLDDYWHDEWRRVAEEMRDLGLPVDDSPPPGAPVEADDAWSMTAYAVRGHAVRMMRAAMAVQPRSVRRHLHPPGFFDGWGRTVAALLRATDVFGLPERRVMMSYAALRESVAGEADLMLQARTTDCDTLMDWVQQQAGVTDGDARVMLHALATDPMHALSAALAHEAWQSWYAELGGEPVAFLLRAMEGGGLAVRLARWALEQREA